MFRFFKKKPTIDLDDEEWQILTWHWLLDNFGGIDNLRKFRVVRPTKEDFRSSGSTGIDHAVFVFNQVASYFNIDPSGFKIVLQDKDFDPQLNPLTIVQNVPQSPLGTYSAEPSNDQHIITINPSNLTDLESLIATFAHEICHPLLLSIPTPPPGEPDAEEFATDLATVFFGFGIFGSNTCFRFSQHVDIGSGSQGWSFSGAGYLKMAEWGYALAVRQILLGDNDPAWLDFLSDSVRVHYKKNLNYLKRNPDKLGKLKFL